MGLLDDKNRLILDAEARFADALKGYDTDLAISIIKLIAQFVQDRTLVFDAEALATLDESIIAAIAKTGYKSGVDKYIANFDALKAINESLHRKVNGIETGLIIEENTRIRNFTNTVIAQLKAQPKMIWQYVDDAGVLRSVTVPNNSLAELVNPIADLIRQDVITGVSFESATERMLQAITDKQLGLERWAGQIARDSLSQADGLINQEIKQEFNLKYTRYVGSIIQTTRPFCYHLLTSREDAVFTDEEIQKALSEYCPGGVPSESTTTKTPTGKSKEKGSGMIPGTTLSNFGINRGGYNCRHEAVPARNRKAVELIGKEAEEFVDERA